jgi:hypothetical protein
MRLLRFRCPHCLGSSTVKPGAEIVFCTACNKPVRLPRPKPVRVPEEGIEDVVEVTEAPPVRRRPVPVEDWEEEEPPRPRPRPRRRRPRPRREASESSWPFDFVSPFLVAVAVLGLLALVLIPVGFVFPPAGAVCMVIGVVANFAGAIWILILAARDGEVIFVLLVPFYSFIYVLRNLGEAGKPFLLQVVGSFMIFGGGLSVGAWAESHPNRRIQAAPPPAVARAFLPHPSGPLVAWNLRRDEETWQPERIPQHAKA